jgi:hypothetical protein
MLAGLAVILRDLAEICTFYLIQANILTGKSAGGKVSTYLKGWLPHRLVSS